jgi:hypothetical protein
MVETVIASIVASTISFAIVAFLARTWIEARLKSSIEHEYKKQFELFQRQLDRQQKVELVAELLAEFIKIPAGEVVPREQRHLLNRLSFQSTLWLPPELAVQLSKRLQNHPDAKSAFELILLARHLLTDDASLKLEHVTFWRSELEQRGDPVIQHARG